LQAELAVRFGVDAARVLVTAGGDEAIDRACRTCLEPGRELILPTPTFEMIGRYARAAGATVLETPWPGGAYPIEEVLGMVSDRTSMIAVVSPNNPTGAAVRAGDLALLAAGAPGAVLLVDLAYAEFADEDLTDAALALPNAVVVRTFSKAFGLAGLRVGYAMGPERIVRAMRSVASPYPVSALSAGAASEALRLAETYVPPAVSRIRDERDRLTLLLRELGARPRPSQANFVLAEFNDAERVWRALAALGIGVRRFVSDPDLKNSLRITCPGDGRSFERLCAGLRSALGSECPDSMPISLSEEPLS
jgi:histidinol-phosphate aminotransferase